MGMGKWGSSFAKILGGGGRGRGYKLRKNGTGKGVRASLRQKEGCKRNEIIHAYGGWENGISPCCSFIGPSINYLDRYGVGVLFSN